MSDVKVVEPAVPDRQWPVAQRSRSVFSSPTHSLYIFSLTTSLFIPPCLCRDNTMPADGADLTYHTFKGLLFVNTYSFCVDLRTTMATPIMTIL